MRRALAASKSFAPARFLDLFRPQFALGRAPLSVALLAELLHGRRDSLI